MTAANKKLSIPTLLQEKCGDAFVILRYNDAEEPSFGCFGSGNTPSVCSPVLAATSPYRGDIKELQNFKVDNSLYMFCG